MLYISQRGYTPEHPCNYLADQRARLEIINILEVSSDVDEQSLALGVRRFGRTYFRPACASCRACLALRVPIETFAPSKSQRRVVRKNADVRLEILPAMIPGDETLDPKLIDLHQRYHLERHEQRGWPHPDRERTESFEENYIHSFLDNPVPTWEFRYWLDQQLIGVSYVGETQQSLNAIYSFYEPDLRDRSLGTFNVLSQLAEANRRGKRYLYLGYYVSKCQSLAYKANFKPHEIYWNGVWR